VSRRGPVGVAMRARPAMAWGAGGSAGQVQIGPVRIEIARQCRNWHSETAGHIAQGRCAKRAEAWPLVGGTEAESRLP